MIEIDGRGNSQVMLYLPRPARRRLGILGACFAAVAFAGCVSAESGGEGGAAGTATGAHGGTTGAGGGKMTAGTAGTIGVGGSGGTSTGTAGVGGVAGTGGTADGGTTGTAGSPGTAGTGRGGVGAAGVTGTAGARGGSMGTAGGRGGAGTSGSGGARGGATGTGGTSNGCNAAPLTGGKTYSGNAQGNAGGSYTYNLYASGGGSSSMTVYGVDAAFSATWSNVGDFIARVGLAFNSTKTPAQIGTIDATFSETKSGSGGGFTYIGIYGWSENPLHEYYIVEDWFGSRPVPGTKMGTITVDGGTYDVLTHTQTNQPSITGTATFVQFWSVRQTPRTCGTISVSQHFSQWANMGMQLGNLEEARLLIEAGGSSSGSIAFNAATVTVH